MKHVVRYAIAVSGIGAVVAMVAGTALAGGSSEPSQAGSMAFGAGWAVAGVVLIGVVLMLLRPRRSKYYTPSGKSDRQ